MLQFGPGDFRFTHRLGVYKKRGVAQPGRVLRSGRRSRRFESSHPDHLFPFDSRAVCTSPLDGPETLGQTSGARTSARRHDDIQARLIALEIFHPRTRYRACVLVLQGAQAESARAVSALLGRHGRLRGHGALCSMRRPSPAQRKPHGREDVFLHARASPAASEK